MQEYSIGGRTFKRINRNDLAAELDRLNAIVMREDIAEKVSQGLGNPTRFFVRF